MRALIREILTKRSGAWLAARRGLLPVGLVLLGACDDNGPVPGDAVAVVTEANYIGGEACAQCHEPEAARWRESHHDLAMQAATAQTVLGDFGDTEFEYQGVTTRFLQRAGEYFVVTDGPDGEPAEYAVRHTFGFYPLQQYLIELEAGKVQALSIAWDSRPLDAGGQRWFHLYPDEAIDFRDPLHWTGIFQRWNTMCAACHSTGLTKGYNFAADRFDTVFSSIDVDCESCHGPGSNHGANPGISPPALSARDHRWEFRPGESIASRIPEVAPATELEVCAGCHSLRSQLIDAPAATMPFLDAYRPSLIDEGLYHADGQILGEVYVYGSFLQSAMARAGVTCSDCHDPHSTQLRADGNSVCAQCHLPDTYNVVDHHRHEPGTPGAECVACHMRAETYMIVDPRRDHSFRVPRPDLSNRLDSPNACNDCHADQSSLWAAGQVAGWYPSGRQNEKHYGEALHAARNWAADARSQLIALITDREQPGIVRATGLTLLRRYLTVADSLLIEQSLEDRDALVRLAAIEAGGDFPADTRVALVQRFLSDESRALRVAAARALAADGAFLSQRRRSDLDAALSEYLEIQALNSDRAEGVLNAAAVAAAQGREGDAERLLLTSLGRFTETAALRINLAELYGDSGRAADAEQVLRAGLAANPEDAAVPLSLGFALVRAGRSDEALPLFGAAAALAPDQPYYQYVLAIATNDTGATDEALALLRSTHDRFPGYPDVLIALATILRDFGAYAEAYDYAQELNQLRPGDDGTLMLLRELEQRL